MWRLRARHVLPMPAAMVRALDPYHRIRATVAAAFLLTVLVLALMTMHGPHHRAGSSASSSSAQVAAPGPAGAPAAH
jgi:hypothetical protein